jgi:hypothetical protein
MEVHNVPYRFLCIICPGLVQQKPGGLATVEELVAEVTPFARCMYDRC